MLALAFQEMAAERFAKMAKFSVIGFSQPWLLELSGTGVNGAASVVALAASCRSVLVTSRVYLKFLKLSSLGGEKDVQMSA